MLAPFPITLAGYFAHMLLLGAPALSAAFQPVATRRHVHRHKYHQNDPTATASAITTTLRFLPFDTQSPAASTNTKTTPSNPSPFSKQLNDILLATEPALSPIAETLDDLSDGYALTYADLFPTTPATPAGQAFLASNLAYTAAGLALYWNTATSTSSTIPVLAFLTEIVSLASFVYHYCQLDVNSEDRAVRLALLIDYALAFTSIFVGLSYSYGDASALPVAAVASGGLGLAFFLLGCTWCATGPPYMIVHGIWHVLSAYCSYVIGDWHAVSAASPPI